MWNSNTARYSEKWVRFWFTQRRTRCAGKKSSQLHDTNSVVALVQKYGMMLENIQINAVCIPGILISEEITNYTVLEMPPKGFPALFDMHIAENIGFENLISLARHWSYR
jgi:DNA polymerase-3 subunit alpha/error-prone DNA polymerase